MTARNSHDNLAAHGSVGDQALVSGRDMYIDIYHIATGYCVKFKAFLSNLSDQYSSEWTAQNVYGRMDPIMNFQHTSRVVSLGFTVPAVSEAEARRNLHAMEHLIMQLYPTYQRDVIAGSPLMKIKFANLVRGAKSGASGPDAKSSGVVAAVQGLSFLPDLEPGFFIPATGELYPKSFTVDLSFTVIHDHPLGFKKQGTWRTGQSFPYAYDADTGYAAGCSKSDRFGVGTFNVSNPNAVSHVKRRGIQTVTGQGGDK